MPRRHPAVPCPVSTASQPSWPRNVEGPPGTGKSWQHTSHTNISTESRLPDKPTKPILLICSKNEALDDTFLKLQHTIGSTGSLRLGAQSKQAESLDQFSLKVLRREHKECAIKNTPGFKCYEPLHKGAIQGRVLA